MPAAFIAAYLLTTNLIGSVLLALALGTIGAAVIGLLVGLLALRRTGIYFAMITVAIAETFFFLENNPLSAWTGGENGIPGVPAPVFDLGFVVWRVKSGWSMYAFLSVMFVAGLIVARRIALSPVGHILTAIRDNPLRAAAVGHAVHSYKLTAFAIAAAYAGLAGGLLGVLQGFMPPEAFSFDTSGQLVIQTVIGSAGTLFGPLVGAAIWMSMQDLLQYTFELGASWKLGLGLFFVALVVLLRRGIIFAVADLVRPWLPPAATIPPTSDAPPAARPRTRPAAPKGTPVLETRDLTKRYGGIIANSNISISPLKRANCAA